MTLIGIAALGLLVFLAFGAKGLRALFKLAFGLALASVVVLALLVFSNPPAPAPQQAQATVQHPRPVCQPAGPISAYEVSLYSNGRCVAP